MAINIGNFIATRVDNYIAVKNSLKNSRFEAYDICHQVFVNAIKTGTFDYDYLALHLYAFLASWGMVCRGNVLLRHNYRYLIKSVKIVCKSEYVSLLDVDIFAQSFVRQNYINLVIELKNELAKGLGISAVNNDTLLSKIMLATLGCVPAYDRMVKHTLGCFGLCKSLSKKGLKDLLDFVQKYKVQIIALQKKYSGLNYSVMKIVDCALWR